MASCSKTHHRCSHTRHVTTPIATSWGGPSWAQDLLHFSAGQSASLANLPAPRLEKNDLSQG
eukprot:CAMPEP_0176078670 /NCGR_PEP_ID=MMETSP0120_2-20121206/39342_1 /TAXON_ID=160619 /ORGANISM="Kryptoperidinium foliaceum, Strain CCMP 1326" /LENGTH=61 /DNA_ID=CAMNT_0017412417 /DNA_START=81 /DNA_END=266 /DNA_ORIENTATION=+